MKAQTLQEALAQMASVDGILGCALVDVEGGMVWCTAGQNDDMQVLSEAATDYWRLSQRLSRHFATLGDIGASIIVHTGGRVTLLPCGAGMLLVALSTEKARIDWNDWQLRTRALAVLVDAR